MKKWGAGLMGCGCLKKGPMLKVILQVYDVETNLYERGVRVVESVKRYKHGDSY